VATASCRRLHSINHPILDNGKCWFAFIDADEYDLDYVVICHRIRELKFPLLPFISKSTGLHLGVVFKEQAEAAKVIPSLKYMAQRLGLKDYEVFPSSPTIEASGNTRAVAMPYGAQWDVLPEQSLLTGHGGNVPADVELRGAALLALSR
jgi:hypothetical protein